MASSPAPNRRRFVFDLHKPIMTGTLLKQGGFHKAFKERYFILYPGFLVYYEDQTTWHYDLQRGETLGGRIGAYKLRGGRVYKTKQHPKGAKYSFVLHAPDPHNKRHEIMFNCKSGEERYQWMHKIASAVPGSPDAQKSPAKEGPAKPEEERAEVKDGAAAEAKEMTENVVATEEPKEEVREVKQEAEDKQEAETKQEAVQSDSVASTPNSVDVADRAVTPDMDTVLGPITRKPRSTSSDEDSASRSSPLEDVERESTEMEPTSSENREEGDVVVTSVSVRVGKEPEIEPEEGEKPEKSEKPLSREETALSLEEHTTEAYAEVQDSPRLSITVINTNEEYTDTSSDEEEPSVVHSFPIKQDKETNESPQLSPSSSTASAPIPDNAEQVCSPKSPVSDCAQEEDNLKPGTPTADRRRPSGVQAFDGRKGYMYKMGGRHKTWKLRYFVLMPGQFSYYKNDPKGKCLGEVKLKNMKIILPRAGEKTYSSFQFTIHTESSWNRRCDYVMAANSERDMKDWIDAFKIAGGLTHINGRSVSPSDSGESMCST